MQYGLDWLKKQDTFEVALPLTAGKNRIARAILYLFYHYVEVYKMREMVEFIIDLKGVFVSNFNGSENEIVNKVANEDEKMFLAFDNEKGLNISKSENENGIVIGKIKRKFRTKENEYVVEGNSVG